MHRFRVSLIIAFAMSPAFAEPVTSSRVNELPAAEQSAWQAYLERSQTNAQVDAAAVQTEVVANKMTHALRAPSVVSLKSVILTV